MEMEDAFKLAQDDTRFIKVRKNLLYTFGATRLPYICLSESADRQAWVTVRTGEVLADKPQISLPGEFFSIEGFGGDTGAGADNELAVTLARRISMPPSKYVNKADAAKREPGPIAEVIDRVMIRLEEDHDVRTGVITAPEQVWGLSVLLYVGSQVARSAASNVQEHFEHLRFRNHGDDDLFS